MLSDISKIAEAAQQQAQLLDCLAQIAEEQKKCLCEINGSIRRIADSLNPVVGIEIVPETPASKVMPPAK
jgi:hypothetical protein